MHAWQRRRIDLTKLLKKACGILFQLRINAGPISAKVTGRFGRWRNRRSISSQTCSMGEHRLVGAAHGRTPLIVVAENLTGIRYRDEIVQPYVIPFIQAQANNVTFQQDNARPHVARVVRDYLTQQNVDLLPCPAVSPDCSPIEHVWDEMERLTLNDAGVCISFSYTAVNTRTAITVV
jgi:hypothetical protein